jgi:hypothetical protein
MLPSDHPYMKIAQEIQHYDNTNYPGIPPANTGGHSVELADQVATGSKDKVAASTGPVTFAVDSSADFTIGAKVVIDTYDSGKQEAQKLTAKPDATHVVVEQLVNPHDGTSTAFPVIQPGEREMLIAEWHEYTPSSGTDIAVITNLATIRPSWANE